MGRVLIFKKKKKKKKKAKGGNARRRPSSGERVQAAGRRSRGRSRIAAVGVVREGAWPESDPRGPRN